MTPNNHVITGRTLVLGDLHLVRETPTAVVDDLVSLVTSNPGARFVFLGDLFDLSADHPGTPKAHALREAIACQPRVRRALAEHVDRGGQIWLAGGNHDSAVGDPEHDDGLIEGLGLDTAAVRGRVRTSPWFFREGGLHLEHGHLYDPDNATSHPLVSGVRSLGVHFVEEFIAPTGAFKYLNMNDELPLKMLLSAFTFYGVRGPYVIFKYFDAAFRAVAKSGPFFEGAVEQLAGAALEADFKHEHGVSDDLLKAMLQLPARPTMESFTATFQRLYLDRTGSTFAMMGGLGLLARGKRRAGATLFGAGALTMGISWALNYDRYSGSVPQLLADGAQRVVDATGAKLVVMGHAHREALTDNYANTGSFSFPRGAPGRPYLEIEGTPDAPRAVRRYLAA
ncbi:MAG: metallophosphoesterase [Polyangiaceae bacterium]